MAGAAKRRNKAERQTYQAASHQPAETGQPAAMTTLPSKTQLPGGLDGPSDDRSASDRPHGFGPSLGYDPARSNTASKPNVPSRLELPAEAYRDSKQVSSIQTNLRTLYKPAQLNSLANSLPVLRAWLAKPTPLLYPAPSPHIYTNPFLFDLRFPPSLLHNRTSYQAPTSSSLLHHPTQSTFYQLQSSIQAIHLTSSSQDCLLLALLTVSSLTEPHITSF
jgi:hypothetical protein